jgi:ABC-type nitrate/sulfonate/bicarbonate transport system substrate-binding protein
LLALLALCLTASSPRAAEPTLVRLSFGTGWDALPALVALERGFFEREGLLVSSLGVTKAEAVINSLAAETTDLALVPQRTLLVMAAAGAPVTVVGMAGWNTRLGEAHAALVRLLNANGLSPRAVEIVALSADELASALEKKRAEAVFASGHFTERIVQNGAGRYVLTHEDVVDAIGYIGAMPLVVSNRLLKRDPDTVQRFLNAWVGALRYIQENSEDVAKILQIFFHRQGIPVSETQAHVWAGMTRFDRYAWTEADVADAEYNGWGLRHAGVLKVEPKIGAMVENRFVQAALGRLPPAAPAR